MNCCSSCIELTFPCRQTSLAKRAVRAASGCQDNFSSAARLDKATLTPHPACIQKGEMPLSKLLSDSPAISVALFQLATSKATTDQESTRGSEIFYLSNHPETALGRILSAVIAFIAQVATEHTRIPP
jgi:hypothetical protein